jgi:hypothetical protein
MMRINSKIENYQLEIIDLWTPNLAIAKYSNDTGLSILEDWFLDIEYDEIFHEYRYGDKYYKHLAELDQLKKYLNNVLSDIHYRVLFSPNDLREIIKPDDIIKLEEYISNKPFNIKDNVKIYSFHAYYSLYPKVLLKKVVPEIFYPLYINIKPKDELHFRIYVTLRSAEISFKMLKPLLDSASWYLEDRYSNEIETIKANLNMHEEEYIKKFFLHHFKFDQYLSRDLLKDEIILDLFKKLESLKFTKSKKKKGNKKYLYEFDEEEDDEDLLDVKLPKSDVYKDFETFKKRVSNIIPDQEHIRYTKA